MRSRMSVKPIIVLFAGLWAFILTGCSDEDHEELVVGNEPSVTANSHPWQTQNRVAKDVATILGTLTKEYEGWTESDSIRIYTLQSMKYNTYRLTDGAGTSVGSFTRIRGTYDYENAKELFALTSCSYLYSFSATLDGKAMIAVDIPGSYDVQEVGAAAGCSRRPVPYWGMATFGSNGSLTATLRGLTALMRIDSSLLPEGTKALVLTTHSYCILSDDMLAGGSGEPLSGMFDTQLGEDAVLTGNPIFVNRDTLRVNIGTKAVSAEHRYLYIPIISPSYSCLHVIAVTGDYRYPYTWDGTLLKTFNAATFKTNTITDVEWIDTGINLPRI